MKIHKGNSSFPLIIMVHGLGMTESTWINPYAERVGRQRLPLDSLLTDVTRPPQFRWNRRPTSFTSSTPWRYLDERAPSIWQQLAARGYNLVTWSQRDPYGPLRQAIDELDRVRTEACRVLGDIPAIVLCHSRGGLIARAYLQRSGPLQERIKGVIFLATPHCGSRIADVTNVAGRLIAAVERIMPQGVREEVRTQWDQWAAALHLHAVEELRPDSEIITQLAAGEDMERALPIRYINIVGVSTCFAKIYRITGNQPFRVREIVSLVDSVPGLIGSRILPEEWIDGLGDGLVAKERAFLSWIDPGDQYEYPVNHATILVDRSVRDRILQSVEDLT